MRKKFVYLATAVLIFMTLCIFFKYSGLRVQDGYDYAQMARNINDGNFFHSHVIIPLTVEKQTTSNNHDMWRPPVFPLMIAAFFLLLGTSEVTILVMCVTAYCIFLVMVYILAKHMYNEKAAILSLIFVGFSPEICWYTLNCLREPVFCAFLVGSIYCLYTCRNAYILGILCATTYLTRYNFLFLLPSFAIYLLVKYKRKDINKAFILKVAMAFFITLSPWCVRNISCGLSPFFTLQRYEVSLFTKDYPHYTVYRHVHVPQPLEYTVNNHDDVLEKGLYYSALYYWPQALGIGPLHTQNIPRYFFPKSLEFAELKTATWGDFFRVQSRQFSLHALVFIVAAFSLLFYSKKRIFYALIIMGILLQVLVLSFVHPVMRHCIPFVLLCTVFVCGEYLQKISWGKLRLMIAVFVTFSFVVMMGTRSASPAWQQPTQQSMDFVKSSTQETDCIATNVPFELSWRTQRFALWLPVTVEDYQFLEKAYPNCRYFYYHSRKNNAWLNTSSPLKEYLQNNYQLIYQYEKGSLLIYFFRKK
ncbi:ArnT family glycosyltransferase [Candidatus Uabimicrobium amorphum]|uniref:Glycosyltransferase RgtA/B/C/D-like domain-containing protein n=1 Tax=Uabimicrobium amorphum TaxID=2596890 RepID=A0A5S9ILC5_UABAM|nr:glycosyltransferase family 39 protein [Candidatus Uabimicrobium amorphum]BBM82695.1 hypothetical protein UABAM_01038 [Candidatus Uabimicrobium amorphum]